MKTRFGAAELYSYATSFGGYLILKYISEHGNPFHKISLRCPAVYMYDVLTRFIMKNDEYNRIMKGKDVQVGFDRKIIVTRPCWMNCRQMISVKEIFWNMRMIFSSCMPLI